MGLEPHGGFQIAPFGFGLFSLPTLTSFGTNLLAIKGAVVDEPVDRLVPKVATSVVAGALYLLTRSNFTLGWTFGELMGTIGMVNERVVLKITENVRLKESQKQQLPPGGSPAAKGITGHRFDQEAGGVMGRKFGQDAGGVMGRKFGQDAGATEPTSESEADALRRLKEKIEMGEAEPPAHIQIS